MLSEFSVSKPGRICAPQWKIPKGLSILKWLAVVASVTWHLFRQGFMSPLTKTFENYFCANSDFDDPIMSQFCTCHDSWAVVACAKLWHNVMIVLLKKSTNVEQNLDYELISCWWNKSPAFLITSTIAHWWIFSLFLSEKWHSILRDHRHWNLAYLIAKINHSLHVSCFGYCSHFITKVAELWREFPHIFFVF